MEKGVEINHIENQNQKGWYTIYGVKYYGHAMKDSIPCDDPYLRNDSNYYHSHPPNYALPNDSHLEAFQIPNEPNLRPSDHLSGDDDSCLEDLIFKNSLEANDSTMENLSLDPLDFDLRENFEEHYLNLNDQMVEGDDLQLEDLILIHSLEENNFIMENLSCEDILILA